MSGKTSPPKTPIKAGISSSGLNAHPTTTSNMSAAPTTRQGPLGASPQPNQSAIHKSWVNRPKWLPRTSSEVESNDPRYAGRVKEVTTPHKVTDREAPVSPSPYEWYDPQQAWTPRSNRHGGGTDKAGPADSAQTPKGPQKPGTRAPFVQVPKEGRLDLSQIPTSSASSSTLQRPAPSHAAQNLPGATVARESAKSTKPASTKPIANQATAAHQTVSDTPAAHTSANAGDADATVSGSAPSATPASGSTKAVDSAPTGVQKKVHRTRAQT